jgi:predicted RNase H-like HicB family nuclease
MKRMKLLITMYRDENGDYIVECPAIPGCASAGHTEAEALANIQDAIVVCLEARRAEGLPLFRDSREIEVPLTA